MMAGEEILKGLVKVSKFSFQHPGPNSPNLFSQKKDRGLKPGRLRELCWVAQGRLPVYLCLVWCRAMLLQSLGHQISSWHLSPAHQSLPPRTIDRRFCPTSVEAELATAFLCPGCGFDYIRKYFFMLRSAIISHLNCLMVIRKILFNMGTPQLSKIFLWEDPAPGCMEKFAFTMSYVESSKSAL